jgi:ribosomal protein S12 methylthiotransferase
MSNLSVTPAIAPTTGRITVGFVNLGCTKNQVDGEVMLGALSQQGFDFTSEPRDAQVVIINTCGFIEEAKQESIDAIIRFGELKKTGACKVLIAAGCLSQRYQDELLKELPELDGVVGTGETARIATICKALLEPGGRAQRVWMTPPPYLYDHLTPRIRLGHRHSAFVKIAEGCNRNCAFCAIPLMRGKQRSRPIESIAAEVRALADEGVQEINLISQDTINYGVDLGMRQGLVALLREMVKVAGIRWIRPFYLYPQQVSDELIALYADEPKITKYVDMPLQHIHDKVLERMHRLGNRVSITALVDRFRARIPGLTFRTSFMVGFPGETKAAFAELQRYVADMEFDRVAVFQYSQEEGTSGAAMEATVSRQVMTDRQDTLLRMQDAISLRKNQSQIGRTLTVLVDGISRETDLLLEARHEGQAPEIDGVVYLNDVTPDLTRSLHPPSLEPPGRAPSSPAQSRSVAERSRPSSVQIDAPIP